MTFDHQAMASVTQLAEHLCHFHFRRASKWYIQLSQNYFSCACANSFCGLGYGSTICG